MADDPRPAADVSPAPGERLESWKEIAAYLRRDVRTVQRWEQTDGLPVHRHKRAHRPIPYAYKAELDAWWTSRSEDGPPAASQNAWSDAPPRQRRLLAAGMAAVLVIGVAAGAYWITRSRQSVGSAAVERTPVPQKSIAVLPFLDLTEGMKQEEFADGITEELIDRLNKVPGLRVPAPTSSFYFKNKHVPLAEIAKALRVANADVVWSETYDRAWSDILIVQDDIAGEVTQALKTSMASPGAGSQSQ